MSDKKFFSISGLGVAQHTPETKEIWQSWGNYDCSKSDMGRKAMLRYASDMGFEWGEEGGDDLDLGVVKEAFNYLLKKFPPITGTKSHILRTAIIDYS
jgi:hypothetical protein